VNRFIPDRSGIENIGQSDEVSDAMKALADEAATEAKRIAAAEAYLSGDYYDSIVVDVGEEDGKAIARINADDFKAWWIEAGTSDTPTFAPLRRGAEAAGLDVRES